MGRERAQEWLETPMGALGDRTPHEMIVSGRTETVLGALLSRRNLIRLLPDLVALKVYDNSARVGDSGVVEPELLLHMERSRLIDVADDVPAWAQKIVDGARAIGSGE